MRGVELSAPFVVLVPGDHQAFANDLKRLGADAKLGETHASALLHKAPDVRREMLGGVWCWIIFWLLGTFQRVLKFRTIGHPRTRLVEGNENKLEWERHQSNERLTKIHTSCRTNPWPQYFQIFSIFYISPIHWNSYNLRSTLNSLFPRLNTAFFASAFGSPTSNPTGGHSRRQRAGRPRHRGAAARAARGATCGGRRPPVWVSRGVPDAWAGDFFFFFLIQCL